MNKILGVILASSFLFVSCVTTQASTKVNNVNNVNNVDKTTLIGEFTTQYKKPTKSRAHNIELAAKNIHGTVVEPGAVFSFNDAVGPTTKKNGFMLGRIFVKGKDSKGYGGGVCQVSSTLYNACLNADMEIVEHKVHSKPVGYVAKGKDAATSYGTIDFKFKNNRTVPVLIECGTFDETVTVKLKEV